MNRNEFIDERDWILKAFTTVLAPRDSQITGEEAIFRSILLLAEVVQGINENLGIKTQKGNTDERHRNHSKG